MAWGSNRASQWLAAAALLPLLLFQVHIDEYQTRFDKEKNPVRRAKLMDKLGDLQFEQIRADVRDDDLDRGAKVLDSYVDDCETAHKDLKGTGADAERKPDGFKQLQVSVRANLLRLDKMMTDIDAEERKPFLTAKKKLEDLDKELIHELFPRQPDGEARDNKKEK